MCLNVEGMKGFISRSSFSASSLSVEWHAAYPADASVEIYATGTNASYNTANNTNIYVTDQMFSNSEQVEKKTEVVLTDVKNGC